MTYNYVCLLLLLVNFAQGVTTVDTTVDCTCEEVTGLIECSSLAKCVFKNNECTSVKCSEATTSNTCTSYTQCAWYKSKCVEFTSCEKYDISTLEECVDLHSGCVFTPVVNTCTSSTPKQKCSEYQSQYNCYKGTDGRCVYLNNQCKLWTTCDEATDSYKCSEGIEKCQWDQANQKCLATPTCQDITEGFCMFAFPTLQGKDANICTQNEKDLTCQDFNPDDTVKETCSILSFGYFKWANGSCKRCDGTKSNYGAVIQLFLLINILM